MLEQKIEKVSIRENVSRNDVVEKNSTSGDTEKKDEMMGKLNERGGLIDGPMFYTKHNSIRLDINQERMREFEVVEMESFLEGEFPAYKSWQGLVVFDLVPGQIFQRPYVEDGKRR